MAKYTLTKENKAFFEGNNSLQADYNSISQELWNVLNAVGMYGLQNEDIYDNTNAISIDISFSNSGYTDGTMLIDYAIEIPELNGSGGFTPVEDITGGYKNTFRQHDGNVTIVHELGHVILQILSGDTYNPSNELANAVLVRNYTPGVISPLFKITPQCYPWGVISINIRCES
ncbi:hypothetical protein [Sulfurimonas sp.]|jgi:hypothetical protein|uniref:hypothetical protein n=1 Tax=Sulfurimonas sp. TaxID=2022749 RepID=UPI0025D2A22E|nr:hypothetical protein [Sulfurimonas sp.]MBT5935095.1 hypothetical protein [Sulfurimonas sp.]